MAVTQEELLEMLQEGVVVTPNIDHLVKLQHDRGLYELYQRAEWVLCDSRLLYLFSQLLPKSLPQAIPGSSFFPAFCHYHQDDQDCRIFLLGGKGDVARRAMDNINSKVGRKMVVDAYSPSLNFDLKPEENEEKWIYAHKDKMPGVKIWMALGATIDFEAGNVKRAPLMWQRLYMEWFYRFLQNPRKMFKRYFIDDMQFFWYFGKQLIGRYIDPFGTSNITNTQV